LWDDVQAVLAANRVEVNGKILDEEACLALEALLVERVQYGVAGAVRSGACPRAGSSR
jgi:hypothetical protein